MAGVTLGFLKYILGFDSVQFRKGMTEAERDLVKLQKSFEKKGQQFQALGKGLTAFVTLPIAGIAAAGIKEAQETQQAMAQVNAALASMGPVAGKTADQLKRAADAFELKSTFEADEILKKVTANLLTFGNIGAQSFDRAQQAALNLSTRLGTDLQSSAILVGKALNDPIKGMTALGRAGIQFSESQKAAIKTMVETGNAAGAQAIVLGELERQFGGAAEAAAKTDPLNQANKAWKQMAETIGTSLLPILPQISAAVAAVANAFASLSPGMQQTIIVVGGVAAAIGPVLIGFGGLIKVIALCGPAVTALAATWKVLQAAFLAARLAALATLPALTPFLIPLAAITAAVVAGYLAWKNWDKIKAIVQNMVNGVAAVLRGMITGPLEAAKRKVAEVTNAFKSMYDKVVGHSYVPDMVDLIAVHFARLGPVMVDAAKKAAEETTEAFEKLKDQSNSLLNNLFPDRAFNQQFLADIKTLDDALKAGIITLEEYTAARAKLAAQPPPSAAGGGSGGSGRNSPLQEWAANAPHDEATIMASLERIAVRGLDGLEDALTGVLMGTKSLKEGFHELAAAVLEDLIRMTIKMALFQALNAAFPGAFGAPGASQGGIVQAAGGGFVSGAGGPTSDSIPAMLSNGEFVINAAATKKFLPLLKQINAGSLKLAMGGWASSRPISNDNLRIAHNDRMPNVSIVNNNDFRGADPSTQAALEARIDRMQRELPTTIIGTVQDAKQRFIIR